MSDRDRRRDRDDRHSRSRLGSDTLLLPGSMALLAFVLTLLTPLTLTLCRSCISSESSESE